ncbi:uncharacterized protein LOC134760612 [Pongo abelii]|uniref:uncharacterized protein LOC134760612 n=1 Tax=Pongo abelii TaxID=9601 RepID=UPI0030048FC7
MTPPRAQPLPAPAAAAPLTGAHDDKDEDEPDAKGYEWTIAVSFQLADFAPLHWLRLGGPRLRGALCPSPSRLRVLPWQYPRRGAAEPLSASCALRALPTGPDPSPDRTGELGNWGHPLWGSHFQGWAPGSRCGARSLPASPLGAQALAAAFVPGKGGAASRVDTRCSRQRSRSPLAGRSCRAPQRRVGTEAGWGGLGRAGEGAQGWSRFGLPGGALRRGTRMTAAPLVLWKNLSGSSSVVRGPRRGVLQGRGPLPTGCARCPGAERTPLLPDRAPSPMEQASAGVPGPRPDRQALRDLFPPPRVHVRPGPGLAGKPRPEEVAVQRGIATHF